jgi:futalosine hydrolase
MHILVTSATSFEITPLHDHLETHFELLEPLVFRKKELFVSLLLTGAGLPISMYAHTKALSKQRYDLVINAGIAGAIDRNLAIGDVVQVVSERFGDLGIEDKDGSFKDLFALELLQSDEPPFENGLLKNPIADFNFLPPVRGVTVNTIKGATTSIPTWLVQANADVESMEGAACFYVCLLEKMPFLEVRAISNYVEPRNRANWNLPLSIHQLNQVLIEMVEGFIQS